jgi:hypothetical protein
MLEYWNTGLMDLENRIASIENPTIFLEPNIPSFHYSAKASLRAQYSNLLYNLLDIALLKL